MPSFRIVWTALDTHVPTVRSSFRQGMTTDNSTISTAGGGVSRDGSILAVSSAVRTGMRGLQTRGGV
jgi:hypothetical protein